MKIDDREKLLAAFEHMVETVSESVHNAEETLARKQHAHEILARIKGAREILLEGSGHLSNLTSTSTYNRAVAEFCNAVEASCAVATCMRGQHSSARGKWQ